ncbi:MAG: helicase-exonuclease AddAB subunit AddB [Clostridia bacterium]|nr:helicase-exonuclease AddAB subunit AddB [Clostridia bacterium]
MGLRFICGTAGTGKTTYCFNEIKQKINGNSKIFIITPEQFSFTAEKKLLEMLASNSVINAEVLTFNRMAYRVMLEVGGASKTILSECGNAILLNDILDSNKPNLKFLGKSEKNIEIVSRMLTELKKHNVSIDDLKRIIDSTEDMYLKTKLNDIFVIYKEYEDKISKNFIDTNDVLKILSEELEESTMFDNSIIYIDEFAGFTTQEYEIIRKLIKKANQVNITVSADWLENNKTQETDIFYQNKLTVEKILKLIEDTDVEEPVILKEKHRFKNKELKFLEENLYNNKKPNYNSEVKNISLSLALNPYSEIEYVAKEIIKLVRDNNYKFSDIAIIAKQIETYSGITKAIFSKYKIPVFIDEKKDLSQNGLVNYVLAIFDALSKNFSYESMFNYIKSGFLDINQQDIFLLENYCIKWEIKGNKWYKQDWTYGNLDSNELEKLNELRNKAITPLLDLKEKIGKEKTVESITTDLYDFLQTNEILEKLSQKINKLENINEIELANEYKTSIGVIIQVLDELVMIFKNKKVSFEKYKEYIKIGLQTKDLGAIPATQDQVIFGDIDRSRSHNVKAVFIIGLNDGIFPSISKDEGFLNDEDREKLKEDGIELAKTTKDRLYEEQYNIYKALTIAEEKLYLSYTSTDSEGKAVRPSILITKIKKMFEKIKEKSDVTQKEEFIGLPEETFDELIENLYKLSNGEEVSPVWKDVYNWYLQNEEWEPKLRRAIKGINYSNLSEKIDENTINKLYGNKMQTSISKLEQYRTCPFSFHLTYGLKLKEQESFELRPIDTGSFMHEVIDDFFEKVKNNNVSICELENKNIEELVKQIIDEKLALARNAIFVGSAKFRILLKKLERVLIESIKYILYSLLDSKFEILGNEVEFKTGGEYSPIEITLENGKKVILTGKIDRVDIAKDENENYVRIIDYKSSSKNIELNEVMFGIQLQLITYLDEIVSKTKLSPAGILYFNLIEPIANDVNKKDIESIEKSLKKKFKMKGLVLEDANVVKMMDTKLLQGYSEKIPVFIDTEGNISKGRSSTVKKEDFANLQKKVRNIIKQISNEIYSGDISIKPYYNKEKKTPCERCPYKTICNFNTKFKGNDYNYIKYIDKEEILEKIKEEENV